jgi:hypothetical protein
VETPEDVQFGAENSPDRPRTATRLAIGLGKGLLRVASLLLHPKRRDLKLHLRFSELRGREARSPIPRASSLDAAAQKLEKNDSSARSSA